MTTYRKNDSVKTEAEALRLIQAYSDFINPDIDSSGAGYEPLDAELKAIFESGDTLEWEEETQREYDDRIAKEESEAEELEKLQTDLAYFLDTKVRPLRSKYFYEWIDKTYQFPLIYQLTDAQITERETGVHPALCDFPASITDYMTDDELDTAIMQLKPTYIS